ncbi:hypothetical protein KKI24_12955 [bacterium]|nr:hypothetical protein [bacterium]
MSIRQKIEDILKENPNISIGELRNQLPEINPGSLKAEFYKLKRKLSGPVARKKTKSEPKKTTRNKSVQQQVSNYLDKNTEASFDTLKIAFPDINSNSLSAYKSVWKKEQEPKEDKPAKKKQLDKVVKVSKPAKKAQKVSKKKEPSKVKPVKDVASDKTELIESLKKTVAAQEKTIQTISKSLDLSTPEIDEEELQGMTLTEIKRIAVTFLAISEFPKRPYSRHALVFDA